MTNLHVTIQSTGIIDTITDAIFGVFPKTSTDADFCMKPPVLGGACVHRMDVTSTLQSL